MPEDFSSCENFRNLRIFSGCEFSQVAKIHNLVLFIFSHATLVSCNPSSDVPKIKFSNLMNQAINGH